MDNKVVCMFVRVRMPITKICVLVVRCLLIQLSENNLWMYVYKWLTFGANSVQVQDVRQAFLQEMLHL